MDPFIASYSYYSPYHFAGNSPIRIVDLVGKEPLDYMENWIVLSSETNSKMETVLSIHDNVTDLVWSVMKDGDTYCFLNGTQNMGTSLAHNRDYFLSDINNKDNFGRWNVNWQRFIPKTQVSEDLEAWDKSFDRLERGLLTAVIGVIIVPALMPALEISAIGTPFKMG